MLNTEVLQPFAGVGEEGPSWGQLLAGLGQGDAVARPLDGGVLTCWGACAPARGPAMAPWLPALPSSLAAARWLLSSLQLRRENEERERTECE